MYLTVRACGLCPAERRSVAYRRVEVKQQRFGKRNVITVCTNSPVIRALVWCGVGVASLFSVRSLGGVLKRSGSLRFFFLLQHGPVQTTTPVLHALLAFAFRTMCLRSILKHAVRATVCGCACIEKRTESFVECGSRLSKLVT